MSAPTRLAPTVCRLCRASPAFRRTFASSSTTTTNAAAAHEQSAVIWPQRQPRGEYYDILLRDPTPYTRTNASPPASSASSLPSPPPSEAPPASSSSSSSSSSPAKTYDTVASRTAYSDSNSTTTAAERARVIFGSRLLGPAERADRAAGRQAKATTVAGVRVPPRPEEPDNCCMSGCVNCVWDLYREEMEEWTLASAAARKRLAAEKSAASASRDRFGPGTGGSGLVGGGPGQGGSGCGLDGARPLLGESAPAVAAAETAMSMDADGGGSERNWTTPDATIAKDMWAEDVFQNVPVGIREFMKQEKRLKEKHQREGTSGG